jgi:hypothetical protein
MDCTKKARSSEVSERFVRLNPDTHQKIKSILSMVTNNRKKVTMDDVVSAAFSILTPDDIVSIIKPN